MFYSIQVITTKKLENQSRFYLGLMLFCLTLFLTINLLLNLGYQSAVLWSYYFYMPALLLAFPFFNNYLLVVSGTNEKQRKTKFIQYLPALSIFLLLVILFGSLSFEEKLSFIFSEHATAQMNEMHQLRLLYWLKTAVIMLVFGQIVFCIKKYMFVIKDLKSKKEDDASLLRPIKTKQLNQLLTSLIIFVVSSVIFINAVQVNTLGIFLYNLVVLLSGFTLGKIALKQVNIHRYAKFRTNEYAIKIDNKLKPVNRKISTPGSTENQLLLASLQKLMKSEKPYLDNKLTIENLANSLDVHKRVLSNVINDESGMNVYGFINQYRINEFKTLIQNPKMNHLSIEGLAQKVGFSSKSSFNTCFKKVTGKTPSQYRNEMQAECQDAI